MLGDFDYLFKIIMIGDSGVGKSSILYQLLDNNFFDHPHTIGVDFGMIVREYRGKKVKLQIWDTAGQENYLSITRSYYRKVNLVMMVYDVNNRKSFDSLKKWINEVENNSDNPEVCVILVGNKIDLTNRVVEKLEGEEYAKRYGFIFIEINARDNDLVNILFNLAIESLIGDIIVDEEKVKINDRVMNDNKKVMNDNKRVPLLITNEEGVKSRTGCCV